MSFPLARIIICCAIMFFCRTKKHLSSACRFLAGRMATFVSVLRSAKCCRFEYSALERSLFPASFGRRPVSCRAKYCRKESNRNRMRFLKLPDSLLACLSTAFPESRHQPFQLYKYPVKFGHVAWFGKGLKQIYQYMIIWNCVISFVIFCLPGVSRSSQDWKQRHISIISQTW